MQVCVVGGGIAGLTTAYLLAKAGRSVALLDDGPLGGGMTQMTSAHLTDMMDDRYFELERLHGAKGARLAAESHTAAIERIEEIEAAQRAGLQGVAKLPRAPFTSSSSAARTTRAARRTIPASGTPGSKPGRARAFPWCARSPSAGAA